MSKLPEFVYLVTVEGEWPVTAIAGDHPSAIDRVADAVKRRADNAHGFTADVRVWRVPVTEAVQMKLTPATVLPASLAAGDDTQPEEDEAQA